MSSMESPRGFPFCYCTASLTGCQGQMLRLGAHETQKGFSEDAQNTS
jgi:hypothetical protein